MNCKIRWTVRGSVSAVSTPIFESKYSLERSWRDLQDLHVRLHTSAPLRPQHFSKTSSIFLLFQNEIFKKSFEYSVCSILMNSCRNFTTIFGKRKHYGDLQMYVPHYVNNHWLFPKSNKSFSIQLIVSFASLGITNETKTAVAELISGSEMELDLSSMGMPLTCLA